MFATGLVAGGALAGVIVALLIAGSDKIAASLEKINLEPSLEHALTKDGYDVVGVIAFALLGVMLYRMGMKKNEEIKV